MQPVRNGAQGRRISLDDRRACFVCQCCKWPFGELHQLRIAKPDHCRLVEPREHLPEGTIVLRSSNGQKLPDSRSVPERCLFQSYSILVGRLLQLAAGLSEPRDTLEDVIEPYLIQLGLIARTARGRCLNGRGYAHLGLPVPQGGQAGLFDQGAASK